MSGLVWWMEAVVAVLLVASGLFALTGAIGLVRLKDYFHRMHPPALASTMSAWCTSFAYMLYFLVVEDRVELRAWAIPVLLSITMPLTTVLLARAALFRKRRGNTLAGPPARIGE